MSRLIDADKLELDSEWSDVYERHMSYSQIQVDCAETVKAIPVDKIKQAREEIIQASHADADGYDTVIDLNDALKILDELMGEKEAADGN